MTGIWDGIRPINRSRPCDLCKSTTNVERKYTSGSLERTKSITRQSNLCLECKSKGWIEFGVDEYRGVRYINTQTNEIKLP